MRLYAFSFVDGSLSRDPVVYLKFASDAAAKQEALLTATDLDHRYRLSPVKDWLRGDIVVRDGDREVVRVPVNHAA
jgi:hypothetical protein